MRKLLLGTLGIGVITAVLVVTLTGPALAASAPALGSAGSFAVLGGSGVSNTGASTVGGDLGVSPGASISGFPPGTISGSTYTNDATAAQAQKDATAAYNAAVAQTCDSTIAGGDLSGLTLTPGVHCLPAGATLNGTVTLDAQGAAGAVFIIKVSGPLSTAGSALVKLAGGASQCNVYWAVSDFARIGALSNFRGTIIATNEARIATNARLEGRLISRAGMVKLDSAVVTAAGCSSGGGPTATNTSTSTSTATATSTDVATETATETSTATATVTGTPPTPTSTATATVTGTPPTATATNTATRTATTSVTVTRTIQITVTVIRTVRPNPTATGNIPPNTGQPGGGSGDLAAIIGVGLLGAAMAVGAGLMLHRRRTT